MHASSTLPISFSLYPLSSPRRIFAIHPIASSPFFPFTSPLIFFFSPHQFPFIFFLLHPSKHSSENPLPPPLSLPFTPPPHYSMSTLHTISSDSIFPFHLGKLSSSIPLCAVTLPLHPISPKQSYLNPYHHPCPFPSFPHHSNKRSLHVPSPNFTLPFLFISTWQSYFTHSITPSLPSPFPSFPHLLLETVVTYPITSFCPSILFHPTLVIHLHPFHHPLPLRSN